MAPVTVLGGTFAGVAAATRLARVGHTVTLIAAPGWADGLRATLGETLDFPAPWRDLFKKTGRPAAGALGLHGLELVADPDGPPTDRAGVWYTDLEALGEPAARAWRDLVDAADGVWQAVRPLGVEAELTPDAVARAGLHPRRSLADIARTLPHPALAARLDRLAAARGVPAADTPAWLTTRLAVERTFGRWRLVDSTRALVPTAALVDVLRDRLDARGVRIVAGDPAPDAAASPAGPQPAGSSATEGVRPGQAVIDTRDPGVCWHRPRPLRRHDSFVDQLLARPALCTPGRPGHFHASASSPAGNEPWAQLLSGALAAYAAHDFLTGEDIRPTNKALR
ncbi:MAG: hypothetical protein QM708_12670 [Propioniciclava sp.]|uniref:hypothetical protein n=1 Tax=Propioniciclava sp. TaxID=2038686 RepID=UPI0039E5F078